MLLDCKGSKKNYTKVSYTGKKEDFIQDYCNRERNYCNREERLTSTPLKQKVGEFLSA